MKKRTTRGNEDSNETYKKGKDLIPLSVKSHNQNGNKMRKK